MDAIVSITIDGKVYKVVQGLTSLRSIVGVTGINGKTYSLSVVSTPSKASTINGNDSYLIQGGEVFTSVHG